MARFWKYQCLLVDNWLALWTTRTMSYYATMERDELDDISIGFEGVSERNWVQDQ